MPPLEHFKYIYFFDEYFCWCTCLAKLAYRFMNIAGDERMCGKYLSLSRERIGSVSGDVIGKISATTPPPPH